MTRETKEEKQKSDSVLQDYIERLISNDPNLISINLDSDTLSDVEAEALSKALENNRFLTSIYLRNSWSYKNDPIHSKINTYLKRNQESAKQAKLQDFLTKLSNNDPTLTSGNLHMYTITNEVGRTIAEALETNKFLTSISWNYSNTVDEATRSQINVYLERNQESAKQAKLQDFLTKLKNNDPTLTSSNLDINTITNEVAMAISKSLENNKFLTSIGSWSYSKGIDEGTSSQINSYLERNQELARQARVQDFITKLRSNNPALTYISFKLDKITDEEVRKIGEAIQANRTLISIDLGGNKITEALSAALIEALEVNTTLTSINSGSEDVRGEYDNEIYADPIINKPIYSQLKIRLERNKTMAELRSYLTKLRSNDTTLTSIYLSSNTLTDMEIVVLAEALKVNNTVTSIHLSSNKITDVGAMAIAEILKTNRFLTSIKLGSHEATINKEILSQIEGYIECNKEPARQAKLQDFLIKLKSNNPALTQISFGIEKITNEEFRIIADAIKSNRTVTKIDLSYSQINDAGAAAIAEVIKFNRTLTKINLRSNKITEAGAKVISDALKNNTTLTKLKLVDKYHSYDKTISEKIISQIESYIERNKELARQQECMVKLQVHIDRLRNNNPTLTELDLSNNQIPPQGIKKLAEALKVNHILTKIDISHNKIMDAGVKIIADAIKDNLTLIRIGMNKTHTNPNGAATKHIERILNGNIAKAGEKKLQGFIARLEQNDPTLTEINLSNQRITNEGAKALIKVLAVNRILTSVNLQNNPPIIDKKILSQIESYIERNKEPARLAKLHDFIAKLRSNHPAITEISFRLEKITNEDMKLIAEALKVNHTLTKLDLRNNKITDEQAMLLAEALKISGAVISISLGKNQVSDKIMRDIGDIRKHNQEIQQVVIPKVTKGKALISEVEASDAKILPPVLQGIATEFDDIVTEGKKAENSLKQEGVYDKYFDGHGTLKSEYQNSSLRYDESSANSHLPSSFSSSFSSSSSSSSSSSASSYEVGEGEISPEELAAFHIGVPHVENAAYDNNRDYSNEFKVEHEFKGPRVIDSDEEEGNHDMQRTIIESLRLNKPAEEEKSPLTVESELISSSSSMLPENNSNIPLPSPKSPNAGSLSKDTDRSRG